MIFDEKLIDLPQGVKQSIRPADAYAIADEINRFRETFPLLASMNDMVVLETADRCQEIIDQGILSADEEVRLRAAFASGMLKMTKNGAMFIRQIEVFAEEVIKREEDKRRGDITETT